MQSNEIRQDRKHNLFIYVYIYKAFPLMGTVGKNLKNEKIGGIFYCIGDFRVIFYSSFHMFYC